MSEVQDVFYQRTKAHPHVLEVLDAPEETRGCALSGLVRDLPHGLWIVARVAALGGDLGGKAQQLFATAAERFSMEDVEALLETEDVAQLRAVLLALGRSCCSDVTEILDMRAPDVVAQYMMHVDWSDEAELIDLVDVLAGLRTAMALWSLDGIAQRFEGPIGEHAEQMLRQLED